MISPEPPSQTQAPVSPATPATHWGAPRRRIVRVQLADEDLVAAQDVREQPQAHQLALAKARSRTGYALCDCCDPPLKLVIRHRGELLHLAAWPDQAQAHARDCPFRSDPDNTHGDDSVAHDRADNETPAQQQPPQASYAVTAPEEGGAARPDTKTGPTLWPLLHHLLGQAELNRWKTGWRRNWALARRVLMRAAEQTVVDGMLLSERLYVPPLFTANAREVIDKEFRDFCLRVGSTREPVAFFLGMVRQMRLADLEGTEFHRLLLQQHNVALYVPHEVAARLARHSSMGWTISAHRKVDPGAPMRVMALLQARMGRDAWTVVDGVMATVSRGFVPVRNEHEALLADHLIDTDRVFERPLSHEASHGERPSFILTDAGDRPTHLHVIKRRSPSERRRVDRGGVTRDAAQLAIAQSQAQGAGWWIWRVGDESMPPLPIKTRLEGVKPEVM